MPLCLECGLAESHVSGCRKAPPRPNSPAEKVERVRDAMKRAEATRAAATQLAAQNPRRAILTLVGASAVLEENPSRDLVGFDEKRAHNDLVSRIAKERDALVGNLPDEASGFLDDAAYIRKAIELQFALACARIAATEFDATPLAKLPVPIDAASASPVNLGALVAEVEERVEVSKGLDQQVRAWKWVNLRNLMTGREPREVPEDLANPSGGGVSGLLGALVGRGASTRRAGAVTQFKILGDKFRDRLYLIAAHGILLRVRSRSAQAEDAWKRHLASNGGADRWEALRTTSRDVIEFYLGVPAPNGFDVAMSALARKSPRLAISGLRPYDEIDPDEWDAFAKAYFFEMTALMNDLSSRDIALSAVAPALIERKRGEPVDTAALATLLKAVRDSWHSRPPS